MIGRVPWFTDGDPTPEDRGLEVEEVPITLSSLAGVRWALSTFALAAGMDEHRAADLTIAVNELATNSLRHGGGDGTLRMWCDNGSLVCEVIDGGLLRMPASGGQRPPLEQSGGRGIWMAEQLCDFVQLRATESGSTVRVRMRL